jgi:DUF4097 and DUF4098 domain-containing protein YvlB
MKHVILSLAICVIGIAPAAAQPQDISKVNGSITAEAGQAYGKLSTVNGSVRIEADARVGAASTVNGAISIADGARATGFETVNGAVRAGDRVEVSDDVETVNGAITFGEGSRIGGSIKTVNGQITLVGTELNGGIRTVNGGIDLGPGTRVDGDVTVAEAPRRLISWGSRERRTPTIVIGPDSEVRGQLVFKREVNLHVHESARIGEVEGAQPQRFSGDRP